MTLVVGSNAKAKLAAIGNTSASGYAVYSYTVKASDDYGSTPAGRRLPEIRLQGQASAGSSNGGNAICSIKDGDSCPDYLKFDATRLRPATETSGVDLGSNPSTSRTHSKGFMNPCTSGSGSSGSTSCR